MIVPREQHQMDSEPKLWELTFSYEISYVVSIHMIQRNCAEMWCVGHLGLQTLASHTAGLLWRFSASVGVIGGGE